MVKVMKKKVEEEIDIGEEYQCPDCNNQFYSKKPPKYCPECRTAFE